MMYDGIYVAKMQFQPAPKTPWRSSEWQIAEIKLKSSNKMALHMTTLVAKIYCYYKRFLF